MKESLIPASAVKKQGVFLQSFRQSLRERVGGKIELSTNQ